MLFGLVLSQAEADRRAIASCLKAGGIDPKVYARFKGIAGSGWR